MKRSFYFLLILVSVISVVSCDKTASYTDMLKAEEKAIERLIAEEGLEILGDFPADGHFESNQFVKLDNNVYLNIIDSGNGQRATLYETEILVRFIAQPLLYNPDTTLIDLLTTSSTWPVSFKYGTNTSLDGYFSEYVGEGLATPLDYVGDSSYVKIIVPFDCFSNGTSFANSGIPVYFRTVRYIFAK